MIKYKIRNRTPEHMACALLSCPAIYEGFKEVTPESDHCGVLSCPAIYEGKQENKNIYLIIGKVVNPADAGLEKKVGEDETLIEVPRTLIDDLEINKSK